MVVGVHYNTADCGTNTHMSLSAGFTDIDVFMILVSDNTDCSLAVNVYHSYFAGRHSYLRILIFLCHKLSRSTCASYKLTALTLGQFDIVYQCTNGNCSYGEAVTGLNVCISA